MSDNKNELSAEDRDKVAGASRVNSELEQATSELSEKQLNKVAGGSANVVNTSRSNIKNNFADPTAGPAGPDGPKGTAGPTLPTDPGTLAKS